MSEIKPRDAEATRARILEAARGEFASLGLAGARVDEIAARAEANKRMIYHYFGNKEGLFKAVLEDAWMGIRHAEQALDLDHLPAEEALERLVRFTWDYYLEHPEFIRLVNSENLHEARHLKSSEEVRAASRRLVGQVQSILNRGVKDGVFRPGIDPVQLNITIAGMGYYYLTNRFTGSLLYERDLMSESALAPRIEHHAETILRLVRA